MWPIFSKLLRPVSDRNAAPSDCTQLLGADEIALFTQIGLSSDELHEIIKCGSLEPHFTYTRYRKPKSSGGWREIAEPNPQLKNIQRLIARKHLEAERPHPAAVAYQTGKSTADHARPHAGASVVVTADVRDFFPSTRAERVEEWWRERVGDGSARLLALLTTDRGALPQGAPTSPALSNLVNVELDERLARHAAGAGARYTRYCDDLAFSWPHGFSPPSDFERAVRAALREFGYALRLRKGWCVYELGDEPEVTGVVLTRGGGVRLPERVRRVMRTLARSTNPRDVQRLDGYRAYAAMVTGRRPK